RVGGPVRPVRTGPRFRAHGRGHGCAGLHGDHRGGTRRPLPQGRGRTRSAPHRRPDPAPAVTRSPTYASTRAAPGNRNTRARKRNTRPRRRNTAPVAVATGAGCVRLRLGRSLVDLALLGLLHQRGGRLEVVAVALGEFPRPRHETLQASLVLVDVLDHATGPRRETDAHDRADVGVLDGVEHALVEALHRLERLGEEHALLQVLERHVAAARVEGLPQARPQPRPLALVVVLVETGARRTALTVVLVDHPVDDGLGRVCLPRAARGLDGFLRLVADLAGQGERELVHQLQRRSRVAGLRARLLDGRGLDTLTQRGDGLVDERADDARGEEAAAVVHDDRRLLDLQRVVEDLRQRGVGGLLAA